MSSFSCTHCGASLEVPTDEDATSARCPYCAKTTLLPKDFIALRRKGPTAPAQPSWGMPMALAVALVVGSLGALVFYLRAASPAVAEVQASPAPPIVAVPPALAEVPTATAPADPRPSGDARATAILKELHARGCARVLLPPSTSSGEQTVDTRLVGDGTCVHVVAVSGTPGNVLELRMKTPLGEPLRTPTPSAEIRFEICPKMAGAYPTTIVPSGGAPYTVAAIECPRGKKP